MRTFCRQPAQKERAIEKTPMTSAASSAPAPRYPRITAPTSPKRSARAKRVESRPGESLRVRGGREPGGALGQQRASVKHAVPAELAFGHHGDARLEDVRQRPGVVDRHRGGRVLLSEPHAE